MVRSIEQDRLFGGFVRNQEAIGHRYPAGVGQDNHGRSVTVDDKTVILASWRIHVESVSWGASNPSGLQDVNKLAMGNMKIRNIIGSIAAVAVVSFFAGCATEKGEGKEGKESQSKLMA